MDQLGAIAAPRRREILRLVWDGPKAAGEIHRSLEDVTFGAVSQHLRALSEAGLVEVRVAGRQRFYSARKQALGPFIAWLEASWDDALYRLKLAAELERTRRGPSPRGRSSRQRVRRAAGSGLRRRK
jgi:DNA-binding transcriptional ArsR family regulator